MTDYTIPRANAPIAGTEAPSPPWYNFLRYLDARTASAAGDVQAEITVIAEKLGSPDGTVDNIPPLGNVTSVQGKQSIASSGIGVVQLRLVNDAETVDAVSFYGTDNAGVKGWNLLYDAFADTDNIFKINTDGIVSFDLTDLADSGTGALLATAFDAKGRKTGTKAATITGTAGRITVANGDAVAGLPTIDLATLSDGGGGALLRFVRDAWGRLSGTSAATTSDLTEGSNLYYTNARADARITLQKAQPLGLATLDSGGKLDATQLPAIAITETFVVASQAAMLALTAEEGDVAVRTDLSESFILTASPPSTLANWQQLLTPTSPVTSVFGRVGSVTAASGDYTFAQIGSKPTTLAGYGITDAEPTIAAGTTAQYWRGDKTWQTLNKAAVGLSNVDNTSDANKPVSTAQQTALDLKLATATPAGYIDGLKMAWNSATSISATSGTCYIQGSSAVIAFPSLLTLSSLSLSASTWYHLYAYLNAGTPAIELVTTAPASPYSGTARSKTGDTSRRYIGSIRTTTGGSILNFLHTLAGNDIKYQITINTADLAVLSGGVASASTSVSLATALPVTSRIASAFIENSDTVRIAFISNSDTGAAGGANILAYLRPSNVITCPLVTNASQQVLYAMQSAGSTTGLAIFITGYNYER